MYQKGVHESSKAPEQMIAWMQAPAGHGKSKVIKTILAYLTSWASRECAAPSAQSGIAAAGIDGRTLHNLMDWRPRSMSSAKKYSRAQKDFFAKIRLITIDESSTMSQLVCGKLSEGLKALLGTDLPFGGIHMLMVGDWLQMGPVAAIKLFTVPISEREDCTLSPDYVPNLTGLSVKTAKSVKKAHAAKFLSHNLMKNGYDAYNQIIFVVTLQRKL